MNYSLSFSIINNGGILSLNELDKCELDIIKIAIEDIIPSTSHIYIIANEKKGQIINLKFKNATELNDQCIQLYPKGGNFDWINTTIYLNDMKSDKVNVRKIKEGCVLCGNQFHTKIYCIERF